MRSHGRRVPDARPHDGPASRINRRARHLVSAKKLVISRAMTRDEPTRRPAPLLAPHRRRSRSSRRPRPVGPRRSIAPRCAPRSTPQVRPAIPADSMWHCASNGTRSPAPGPMRTSRAAATASSTIRTRPSAEPWRAASAGSRTSLRRLQDQAARGDRPADDQRRALHGDLRRPMRRAERAARRRDHAGRPRHRRRPGTGRRPSRHPAPPLVLCVRHCDGAYYPLATDVPPDRLGDMDRLCQAQCPAAASSAYAGRDSDDIADATAVDGTRYSDLPTAFQFRKGATETCACRAPNQSWAEALAGRRGHARAAQGRRHRYAGPVGRTMARPVSPPDRPDPAVEVVAVPGRRRRKTTPPRRSWSPRRRGPSAARSRPRPHAAVPAIRRRRSSAADQRQEVLEVGSGIARRQGQAQGVEQRPALAARLRPSAPRSRRPRSSSVPGLRRQQRRRPGEEVWRPRRAAGRSVLDDAPPFGRLGETREVAPHRVPERLGLRRRRCRSRASRSATAAKGRPCSVLAESACSSASSNRAGVRDRCAEIEAGRRGRRARPRAAPPPRTRSAPPWRRPPGPRRRRPAARRSTARRSVSTGPRREAVISRL